MKKDDIVFALYCTVAVATTVHAGVEIWKTFRTEKTDTPPLTIVKKTV
jgi:hypothetical protein